MVSCDSGEYDGCQGKPYGKLKRTGGDENSCTDEQGVCRQEESGEEPRLGESHCHEEEQCEGAERRQQCEQEAVHGGTSVCVRVRVASGRWPGVAAPIPHTTLFVSAVPSPVRPCASPVVFRPCPPQRARQPSGEAGLGTR
ncbi:hypothetical protein GCM10028802_21140 [Terrabacter terrigena]